LERRRGQTLKIDGPGKDTIERWEGDWLTAVALSFVAAVEVNELDQRRFVEIQFPAAWRFFAARCRCAAG